MMDQILITIHAVLGGLSLLAGLVALVVKKGSAPHRLAGKIFVYSLACASLLAVGVTFLPGHESPFLFAVGVFTLYLIGSGYRALSLRNPGANHVPDLVIAATMILTGGGMILLPWLWSRQFNVVLAVFGTIGILLAMRDLRVFRNPEKYSTQWLEIHLGKMIGGYIAAVTAFLVVNQVLPGIVGWLAPTIVGTPFIVFWSRKVRQGFFPKN